MASKEPGAVLTYLPGERLQPAVRREQQCMWRAAIELLAPIVERTRLLARQAKAPTQLHNALLPRLTADHLRLPETEAAVNEPSAGTLQQRHVGNLEF